LNASASACQLKPRKARPNNLGHNPIGGKSSATTLALSLMNGAYLKYKTAHYISGTTRDLYPLIPQVMNGTGPLRQFVVKAARHSSRAAFEYLVAVLCRRRLDISSRRRSNAAGFLVIHAGCAGSQEPDDWIVCRALHRVFARQAT